MKAVIFETPSGMHRVGVERANHNGKSVILASVGVSTLGRAAQVKQVLSSLCALADWKKGQPNCRAYQTKMAQSLCLKAVGRDPLTRSI